MTKRGNNRILAAILAAMMLLSNIPVAAFAQEQTYCGLEHEHEQACYIDPMADATDPEETEPEVTDPEETEPEVTEPEETEPEESFYEKLLAAETVQALCDLLTGDSAAAAALTAAELAAVKSHAASLYGKLEAPTGAETAAHEQIIRTVTGLEEALQGGNDDPTDPTDPEVTEPEVTEPEVTEPEVTEPEVTEPEVTEPEVTEPEVTEPKVTEPEVTEPEVTEPEITFFQQLLDCESAEQMYLLVLEDMQRNNAAKLTTLTTEELTSLTILAKNFPADAEGVNDRADLLDTLALFGGEDIIGDAEILLPEIPEGYIDLNAHYAGKDGHAIGEGKYILTSDLTLTAEKGSLIVPTNHTVVIDLNGHVLKGNGSSSVIITRSGDGDTLTIKDSSAAKTGGITGGVAGSGGGIYALIPVIIDGGNIYGNTASGSGGGIYCNQTLTINGGKIYGNRAYDGGGVYASTVVMNGGVVGDDTTTITWSDGATTQYPEIPTGIGLSITNINAPDRNTATHYGGGIYAVNGLTLNGAAVVGNYASNYGGGILNGGVSAIQNHSILYGNESASNGGGLFQSGGATVTITNSKIACNVTATYGAGIDAGGNVLVSSGADVIYNTAKNNGGGITVENKGYCEVNGGRISYNYAAGNGGGFRCVGTIDLISGEVNYNFATNGGGISARTDSTTTTTERIATVYLNGGAISRNTATGTGGGIHIEISAVNRPVTAEANGAEISHNTAGASGGGMYVVAKEGTINVDLIGGTLSNNKAKDGGGISMSVGANVAGGITVSGTAVSQNTATASGGGVYLAGGTFTLDGENALIQENTAKNGGGVYLTGGQPNLYRGSLMNNTATGDGGGIYINQQNVTLAPTGDVSVTGNKAVRGAGIFIGGTDGTNASFSADKTAVGKVEITDNTATGEGGGVCISKGYFELDADNITLQRNQAASGGAVAVLSGNFTMSGGMIDQNTAENGGAVYVSGGNVALSNGQISENTANGNGGGIAVNNGAVYMSGGAVSSNKASSGAGGGIYVSSTGANDVTVKVYSGTLAGNSAATSGGAVAVKGESGTITVQTGVNENHKNGLGFTHTDDGKSYTHASCPVIQNNGSGVSGGAFYVSGNSTTHLDIFCLDDAGNTTGSDTNPLNEHMSTFLMVEGGVVYLSTSTHYGIAGTPGATPDGDDVSGKLSVSGSIHVVSGVLELFGSKDNPRLENALTIDLQSSDDRYIDHRTSHDKITVSYHENFYRPDGTPDSAQTAFDIENGKTHQIYGGLYAHEGYQLYGWNTDKNANAISTEDGWYKAQDVYTFYVADDTNPDGTRVDTTHYGNLTLYAIWKVNGYFVEFVPGIPESETWTGEAWTETYTYNEEKPLPENKFVWPGHVFAGWKLPDGNVKQPGAEVLNLTNQNAATVTVTAQWKPCEHPDAHVKYTSNGTDTLTKTCELCGLTATAKLTAQDAVYDGNRHEATLECSNADFWNPTVNYVGFTIKPQDAPEGWQEQAVKELCVSAGNYTASITSGEESITVNYTIAKAKQTAPQTRPTYEQPVGESSIVTINLLHGAEQKSPESGADAVYYVRYYENGAEATEEAVDTDTETAGIQHNLTKALKTYAVLVGYPETDDYLASDFISAETTFVFAGSLHLTIKAEEGIDFWPGDSSEQQMAVHIKLRDGYYLITGNDFTFAETITKGSYELEKLGITKDNDDPAKTRYYISAETADQETHITITIGGVKKKATVTGYAKEKQHFSDFSGSDSIAISRDSAFTARFDVANYDATDYDAPQLSFSPALPAGTTIILRDRSDESYWYTVLQSEANTVALTSFTSMVSGGSYQAKADMKLQFIVDFSRCTAAMSGDSLTCTFSVPKKGTSNAAELTKTLTIELAGASLNLRKETESGAGLTQKVTVTANVGAAASKYDHRDVALVLTPSSTTALPKDAYIQMNLGGSNSTWRPDQSGRFFISLGNFRPLNAEIVLELISDMFPMEQTTYEIGAALYLSASDAEIAPLNGYVASEEAVLTFTSDRQRTGIDITVENDQRLFTTADDIAAKVEVTPGYLDNYYNVVVELHQEFEGNTFGNTTIAPQETGGTYTFDLAGRAAGDYCVVASLQTKSGYVLNEARYYFIIHPVANSGT